MDLEFLFIDAKGRHVFSKFVPEENADRAFSEFQRAGKILGLMVFKSLPTDPAELEFSKIEN